MKTTKTQAMAALRRAGAWIAKLTWDQGQRENNQHHAVNVVVGAMRVCRGCGVDLQGWVARRPHRKAIREPAKKVKGDAGRKAMVELVELAISALEARTWDTHSVEVGPLPVGEAKPMSDERRKAMAETMRARNAARQQAEQEARQRRAEYLAGHRGGDPEYLPPVDAAENIENPRENGGVLTTDPATENVAE